jgi:hypothetical protein
MFCEPKSLLELFAEFFEICTPIVLLSWFIFNRRRMAKSECFKELVGSFGGFVNDTVNKAVSNKERYDGGIVMDIISFDNNGYFNAEFLYAENKSIMGEVGGNLISA